MENQTTFTNTERAALVLMGLDEETAAKVLQHFTRNEVQQVTLEMSRLRGMRADSARQIIQDFFVEFESHSGIKGANKSYLSKTLRKALGNNLAKGMLATLYGDEISNKMKTLQWVEAEPLSRLIADEHPEMQAIFLSYLDPETASAVLMLMPEAQHDQILFRIGSLTEVNHEVIDDLTELVDKCIEHFSLTNSSRVSGAKMAADIINRYGGDRAKLMELIKLNDEDVADTIEDNMYDFVLLCRQERTTMDRLVQEINPTRWAVALKGAEKDVIAAVTNAMPARLVKSMNDEMEALGPVPLSRVETARIEIMNDVRDMARNGDIELILYQEPTVE